MSETNADQRDFWTDQAGPTWVREMAAMDRLLAPVLDGVLSRAALRSGDTVLDIGCGAGTSTLEAGHMVGPGGRATGLDISATLIDVAQKRAADMPQVDFLLEDAQTFGFAPASIDGMISRFGVMFFDAPHEAFANMATALRSGGTMTFATWGPIPDNPYFTLPAQVAKRVLGPVPKSDPDAPGPFAFREVDRVTDILNAAGMAQVQAETVEMALTPTGDVNALVDLMCQIGPAQGALAHHQATDAQEQALKEALAEALDPFQSDTGLHVPASINFFRAIKPA